MVYTVIMKTFILLSLVSTSLFAQGGFTFNKETGKAVPNFVGELKLLKGRVLRTTGGRPRVVQIGEKFYPKDVVVTEKDSSMKILITDDTWLALGPDSELVFSDFEFKDKDDRRINYELRRGQISAHVRQKIKAGEVNFRSRYASMGVRGTKLMMNYREVKGVGVTEYAIIEGKGEVFDAAGTSHPLDAGKKIVLQYSLKNKTDALNDLPLTPEDLKNFASPESGEEKAIEPFMPYYTPAIEEITTAAKATAAEDSEDAQKQGEGSFQNLKKLNEQLQDNRKKRR